MMDLDDGDDDDDDEYLAGVDCWDLEEVEFDDDDDHDLDADICWDLGGDRGLVFDVNPTTLLLQLLSLYL